MEVDLVLVGECGEGRDEEVFVVEEVEEEEDVERVNGHLEAIYHHHVLPRRHVQLLLQVLHGWWWWMNGR